MKRNDGMAWESPRDWQLEAIEVLRAFSYQDCTCVDQTGEPLDYCNHWRASMLVDTADEAIA